jgi:acyl dehydratase
MKEYRFRSDEVEEWRHNNSVAGEEMFGEDTVPGMMLLDKLNGLVTEELGDDDQEVVLSGITAARFRDPVYIDEYVTITLCDIEEGNHYTTMDFECRAEERDSLVAHGALTAVVK